VFFDINGCIYTHLYLPYMVSGKSDLLFQCFLTILIGNLRHNNNDPNENGRAFRTGVMTFAANAGGIVSCMLNLLCDPYRVPLLNSTPEQPIYSCKVMLQSTPERWSSVPPWKQWGSASFFPYVRLQALFFFSFMT
jgi:hypothetical protein